jgi:hypothetical protein
MGKEKKIATKVTKIVDRITGLFVDFTTEKHPQGEMHHGSQM